ncbi:hypothetical protein EZS27_015417 [termite gut metagenome]|uniref:DUF3823 domain-containing protein n=1 Tax=termite gut metagenome TaxID=433724 RepID=A0A5J4RSI3_9ZZZZ
MKKLIFLFIASALILSSCENDNYAEPDAGIQGTVTDIITGKSLLTEQPNGFQIRNKEISWNGTDIVIDDPDLYSRKFWGRADGTFTNTKMFAATYQITPVNGAFHTVDIQTVELKSGKMTTIDFNVLPYVSFSNVSIVKDPANSLGIIATFTVNVHATESEPATIRNYRLFATNRSPYVGAFAFDDAVSSANDVALTPAQLGNPITIKQAGFVKGKTYYLRLGARCKESPQDRYNMTEIVKLEF